MKNTFLLLFLVVGFLTFNSCKNSTSTNQTSSVADSTANQPKPDYKILYGFYEVGTRDYENNTANAISNLSDKVNSAIKEGYKPVGGVSFYPGFISQAVVK